MHDPFKTPGAFSWNELMTSDPAAAKTFYQGLFGWKLEEMDMGQEGKYTVIKSTDGEPIGGVMGMPPGAEGMPPAWGAYVTVEDADAILAKAESLGAKVIVPPRDIPKVGRFAVFQDPQGATLAVIAYVACD